MVLSETQPEETGSQKSKIEVEIMYLHVTQLIYMTATKFQRLYHIFGIRKHGLSGVKECRKSKMAVINRK